MTIGNRIPYGSNGDMTLSDPTNISRSRYISMSNK